MSSANVVVHIVDDEESVRSSLAFLLDTAGFAVRTHATAQSFLDMAAEVDNGCLVTDLRMPDIDGVELLRRLKAAGTMVPSIVVTGHGDVQMAVEAMKNGAIDFIEKPFSQDTIISSILRAVDVAASQVDADEARARTRDRLRSLGELEMQVLRGVVDGLPNKLIAVELGLSPRAVEACRATLMGKLQAASLSELIRMVSDIDLSDPDGLEQSA